MKLAKRFRNWIKGYDKEYFVFLGTYVLVAWIVTKLINWIEVDPAVISSKCASCLEMIAILVICLIYILTTIYKDYKAHK